MARRRVSGPFHVMLLAGGSGTRFWPLSRGDRPKQFLPLGGRDPLLVQTWKRARRLVPPERLWVIAPEALSGAVRRMLPQMRRSNLILEPSPRDTAPAIALGCATLYRRDADAVVGIFPTDHVVSNLAAFVDSVKTARREAENGALVCLGIRPDRPATGFGYLKCASPPRPGAAVDVERFVEKPDVARARRFVKAGRYLWNGGMFVWKVERFLDELGDQAPAILRAVSGTVDGRRAAWRRATRISVDYAVMEGATGVRVVPLDAGWDDVGSWDAAARLREGGRKVRDRHVRIDSEGSAVFADDKLVALVDMPGVVIVDTPDALLVVPRDRSERVREVVEELRRTRRKDRL